MPTHETTPVWARTVPVVPLAQDEMSENGTESVTDTASEAPLPAKPMKEVTPDWSKTDGSTVGSELSDPKQAVPMQKQTPSWAQTVPAPAGEPLDSESAPEESAEATHDAPADDAAHESSVPEATDIWPPEPPTEHTMPAWPPSSTVNESLPEPSTIPETGPVDSGPESFDAVTAPATQPATISPSPGSPAKRAAKERPASTPPPAATSTRDDKATPAVAASTVPPATAPPANVQSATVAQATVPPATTPPVTAAASIEAPATVRPATAPPPAPALESKPPLAAEIEPPPPPEAPPAAAPAPAAPEPAAPEPAASGTATPAEDVDWPAPVDTPAWAPRVHIATKEGETWSPTPQPAAPAPQPAPKPAPAQPQPAAAQAPVPPAPARSQPQPSIPPPPPGRQPAAGSPKSTWEVVQQKAKTDPKQIVPTPEDRSYAEWFSWAKRGGAPASACHAAAQGAFQALSSGKDVATAVQWATAAMARPPVPVSAGRQTYCAWFSLGNIDLNLDPHRAHAFATAAVHALDAGADAGSAHAAGLAAAGVK